MPPRWGRCGGGARRGRRHGVRGGLWAGGRSRRAPRQRARARHARGRARAAWPRPLRRPPAAHLLLPSTMVLRPRVQAGSRPSASSERAASSVPSCSDARRPASCVQLRSIVPGAQRLRRRGWGCRRGKPYAEMWCFAVGRGEERRLTRGAAGAARLCAWPCSGRAQDAREFRKVHTLPPSTSAPHTQPPRTLHQHTHTLPPPAHTHTPSPARAWPAARRRRPPRRWRSPAARPA
jgi:hypothetical protein